MYYDIGPIDLAEDAAVACAVTLEPGPGGSRILDLAVELPMLRRAFPTYYRAALVGLWPSSQIVAHRDAPIRGVRYHVPLIVNPDCWSFHDGVWQQLEVGRGYKMDPTDWHGAVNWGAEVRLHLIVDVAP